MARWHLRQRCREDRVSVPIRGHALVCKVRLALSERRGVTGRVREELNIEGTACRTCEIPGNGERRAVRDARLKDGRRLCVIAGAVEIDSSATIRIDGVRKYAVSVPAGSVARLHP